MPLPPPPAILPPRRIALFLDFDGTLAEIVDDPAAASIPSERLDRLVDLSAQLGGALAVVSGRSIDQLDRFLAPFRPPAAGVHGMERRDVRGRMTAGRADPSLLDAIEADALAFAAAHPGVLVESKPTAVAVHYRRTPLSEEAVLAFARAAVSRSPTLRLLRGKMVAEITAGHRTKGDALADFLAEEPFAGRLPVFAGDDLTDESGFRVVAASGGIAIKIGAGLTAATHRLDCPRDLHRWLDGLLSGWTTRGAA